MRIPAVLLPALVLAITPSCKKDEAGDQAVGSGSGSAPQKDPTLKLVEAGAEPRKQLRYHVAKGSTKSVEFAMDIDMNAGPIKGAMPRMIMIGDLAVSDVTDKGDMAFAMTIHGVDLQDRPGSSLPADTMRAQMA